MSSPPGLASVSEPRVEQISAEREPDLSTRTGQMRYLVRELGVTRLQAHALLRAYALDLRDADARRATREEFAAWFQRRGDLISMRSKPRASTSTWRTHS